MVFSLVAFFALFEELFNAVGIELIEKRSGTRNLSGEHGRQLLDATR